MEPAQLVSTSDTCCFLSITIIKQGNMPGTPTLLVHHDRIVADVGRAHEPAHSVQTDGLGACTKGPAGPAAATGCCTAAHEQSIGITQEGLVSGIMLLRVMR